MEQRFLYIGCFPDPKEFQEKIDLIGSERLAKVIDHPHVTFVFAPTQVDTSLFGEKIRVRITGYGKNDKNEGVSVTLQAQNPTLQQMIDDIPVPHITISVGPEGVPVDTRHLKFRDIPPMDIWCVFGAMTPQNKVITQQDTN